MNKKKIVSLLLVLSLVIATLPMAAFAEDKGIKIADAFPDRNFRSYVRTKLDIDDDGFLSDYEIAMAISLDVSHMAIKDVKGIELLSAMERFDCTANHLTSLDLSKNKKLKSLTCHYNDITSLAIPQNTELRYLNCAANDLSSLDVSKTPNWSPLVSQKNNIFLTCPLA